MRHNKKIKIAVFPIAGMGTRFLPITKTISKEMLNILDRPLLDYAVQEAKAAGIETFIFVKDQIAKYQLGIDINSKPLKNKMVEINTTFKFQDKENNKKKSYFEIINTTIVKVNDKHVLSTKNEIQPWSCVS